MADGGLQYAKNDNHPICEMIKLQLSLILIMKNQVFYINII